MSFIIFMRAVSVMWSDCFRICSADWRWIVYPKMKMVIIYYPLS